MHGGHERGMLIGAGLGQGEGGGGAVGERNKQCIYEKKNARGQKLAMSMSSVKKEMQCCIDEYQQIIYQSNIYHEIR